MVGEEHEPRASDAPEALAGAPRALAIAWVLAVVGVYFAVREFGLALLH